LHNKKIGNKKIRGSPLSAIASLNSILGTFKYLFGKINYSEPVTVAVLIFFATVETNKKIVNLKHNSRKVMVAVKLLKFVKKGFVNLL